MLLLVLHAAATWFMTGLIWLVQAVHYPLFSAVGEPGYAAYQAAHVRGISPIVMPAMLLELGTALGLALQPPAGLPPASAWLGLALIGLIWIATALYSVPAHEALAAGFDAEAHQQLVSTNWIRTLAWSARAGLVAWWLVLLTRGAP
ncbi:MAG: hypothetical protein H6741_01680 [Alphaproteobacteria bacterium]|nr:hypothetical protein [Alphaproteobacteria bacterium]